MNLKEAQIIHNLQQKGYKVVIKDVFGQSFTQRYEVYSAGGFHTLKKIVVDNDGVPQIAQG